MRTFAAILVWGLPPLMLVLALCLPVEWAIPQIVISLVLLPLLNWFGGWADRRWPARP